MDDMIRSTMQAYIGAFDAYDIKSDSLKAEVDKFKQDVEALAESCSDIGDFSMKYQSGGYMDTYMGLFNKLSAQATNDVDQYFEDDHGESSQAQTADTGASKTISVKDFVEQYRYAYNEIKNSGVPRPKALKAYEDVFAVADRTDDIIEAQIIMEKERLLFKIASVDITENAEHILDGIDPYWDLNAKVLQVRCNSMMNANSDEELTYNTEFAYGECTKVQAIAELEYSTCLQIAGILTWWDDDLQKIRLKANGWKDSASEIIELRRKAKTLWPLFRSVIERRNPELKEKSDIELFDAAVEIPFIRLSLLVATQADEKFYVKKINNPENIEAIRYMLFDEILSPKSIKEILITARPMVFYMKD